jgi:hypothetical protein
MSSAQIQTTAELQQTAEKLRVKVQDFQNQLLNKFNKIDGAQGAYLKLLEQRKRAFAVIQKYPTVFIITAITVFSVCFYFLFIYKRIQRFLKRTNIYQIQANSVQDNEEVMNGDFKLCDFYVASSYKSYLPCTNYYDYASISSIEKMIKLGARFIDLDIYNESFDRHTEPVICAGNEIGNWHYTTSISFEETCKMIAVTAFNSTAVHNAADPFFICLNFKTWYNKDTINRCAEIIKLNFQHKLLSPDYGWQGRQTSSNIAIAPIKELFNKIIIIATGDIEDTDMDELCNLHPKKNINLRAYTNRQVKDSYDPSEMKEYNKRNLTLVTPDFDIRTKENYNFYTPYYLGCQFICMNYTEPTEYMKAYAKRFQKCSFILKPLKLRYKPILVSKPFKQSQKLSFAPRNVTTPIANITF